MVRKRSDEPRIVTYLHNKAGKMGLPVGATFELTSRCNFNCPMCYVHQCGQNAEARKKELTTEQWIDIARQTREKGTIFVLLTGGEPFLREDFFEIYSAMKKMGFYISINSNGSLLDGEIRRKLLEDPPFRINISLYGGCAETYKNMCGAPMYEKVLENIKALKEAGIDVSLNVSLTPYNKQDTEKIFNIASEIGVVAKAVSYMYPPIRINGEKYGENARLTPKEAAECTVKWDLLRFSDEEFELRAKNMKECSDTERDECLGDVSEGVNCRAGKSSMWLTWDGKMYPCGMLPTPVAYPLEVGVEKAWEHINTEVKKIRLPSKCASCHKKNACFSCAAVCYTETGGFDRVPTYVCEQVDETIAQMWDAYVSRSKKEVIE